MDYAFEDTAIAPEDTYASNAPGLADRGIEAAPTLQQWFRTAGRYPLLDHAAEIRCHRQMERAADTVLRTLARRAAGRQYLRAFLTRLAAGPPRREAFSEREGFYELHRETNQLTEIPATMAAIRELLQQDGSGSGVGYPELAALDIPRPCLVAMAQHLGLANRHRWSTLVRALDEWLGPATAAAVVLEPADRTRLLRLRERYLRARDRLVLHNLRLVNAIVMRQRSQRQLPILDLVQEGCTGLMRAADKYDASTGYRFSTYAYNWVTQAVRRASDSQHGLIRLPANVGAEVARVHRARRHLADTGTPADARRLAEASGRDLQQLDRLLQVHDLAISLSSPVAGDSDLTLEGTIAAPDADGGETACEQAMARRTLRDALQRLPERHRLVVSRRWGLEGPAETLEQVSARLGVSREWVRQIERQALADLAQDGNLKRLHEELS